MTTPLTKKLRLLPGHRAIVLNAPTGYADVLAPLPDGATMADPTATDVDFALVFIPRLAAVTALIAAVKARVKYDGVLWVAYPKGGAKAGTDLNRDILGYAVMDMGLQPVAQIAIDTAWVSAAVSPAGARRRLTTARSAATPPSASGGALR